MSPSLKPLLDRISVMFAPDIGVNAEIECTLPLDKWTVARRISDNGQKVITYYDTGTHGTAAAPNYTGSVDRALLLVPKGWFWQMETFEGGAIARVERRDKTGFVFTAPTAACALTGAALQAISANGGRE